MRCLRNRTHQVCGGVDQSHVERQIKLRGPVEDAGVRRRRGRPHGGRGDAVGRDQRRPDVQLNDVDARGVSPVRVQLEI